MANQNVKSATSLVDRLAASVGGAVCGILTPLFLDLGLMTVEEYAHVPQDQNLLPLTCLALAFAVGSIVLIVGLRMVRHRAGPFFWGYLTGLGIGGLVLGGWLAMLTAIADVD